MSYHQINLRNKMKTTQSHCKSFEGAHGFVSDVDPQLRCTP